LSAPTIASTHKRKDIVSGEPAERDGMAGELAGRKRPLGAGDVVLSGALGPMAPGDRSEKCQVLLYLDDSVVVIALHSISEV
jgi:2-keto-4-pentenoate hydratase